MSSTLDKLRLQTLERPTLTGVPDFRNPPRLAISSLVAVKVKGCLGWYCHAYLVDTREDGSEGPIINLRSRHIPLTSKEDPVEG